MGRIPYLGLAGAMLLFFACAVDPAVIDPSADGPEAARIEDSGGAMALQADPDDTQKVTPPKPDDKKQDKKATKPPAKKPLIRS